MYYCQYSLFININTDRDDCHLVSGPLHILHHLTLHHHLMSLSLRKVLQTIHVHWNNTMMSVNTQKSDNKIPWLFHNNLRCFPWCQEGKHRGSSAPVRVFITYHMKRKSNDLFKLKRVEKMVCLLANITIWNLEHKPKASHSQITAVCP